ncbi:hypothetical protein STXM2123_4332 [Streptomyces sp. F-3]|nr:hypothetical protein STXM2123_4332 [Streptomyces sp. F-3]
MSCWNLCIALRTAGLHRLLEGAVALSEAVGARKLRHGVRSPSWTDDPELITRIERYRAPVSKKSQSELR